MEWNDEGIVIYKYSLGESFSVIHIFTKHHGRFVANYRKDKKKHIDVGDKVHVKWKGRKSDQLGFWSIEEKESIVSNFLHSYDKLLALQSICCFLHTCLPERHPYELLYDKFYQFLQSLCNKKDWFYDYVFIELEILSSCGFGLSLKECVVTKSSEDLIYISPKSGKAVSRLAGKPYKTKLLHMPNIFKMTFQPFTASEYKAALDITGYFLKKHLFTEKPLPFARDVLIKTL
ncbi:MAG: DNA repair protein RecO [Alphaproteobacteria bacterium]